MTKAALVLVAGIITIPAWAQNYDEGDAPDNGVARISLLSGDVSVQRGDTGELVAGELNAPLVAVDHVLTGPNSRAEVQFDYSNMIRLGPVSEVRIGELRENDYFIQVAEGTTTFRILQDTRAQVEISTPTVSIRPVEKGVYRITVRPDGATEITVRSGQAEISTPRGIEILRSGRTMQARGTVENPEFMILSAISKDDWDRWNEDRDRDLERSKSYQYVSNTIPGAYDLDNYGRWVYDSPYGWVWVPNVATTWAPYRVGRWSWVNYYGWTWVSGDPWGWAPYHYGNWYSSPYGWAWYPGSLGYRYYWRPALVGFFGWGNGSFNIGVGFGGGFNYGNIGWVPLAPYERFNPWYGPRFRGGFGNNITVINNTNIVNVYRNARQFNGRNGVTSISAGNFGRGRINTDNYVRVTNTDLTRAGRVQGQIPFEQNRDSRRYSDRNPAPEVEARVNNGRERQFAPVSTNADRSRRGGALAANVGTGPSPGPSPNTNGKGGQGKGSNTADRSGVNRGADAAPSSDWRRFGTANSGDSVNADRSGNTRANSNTRGATNAPVAAAPGPTRNSTGNSPANDTRSRRPSEFAPRSEPRSAAPVEGGSVSQSRRSQPVQINPPIVRDRGSSAPTPSTNRSQAPSAPSNRSVMIPSAPRGDSGSRGTVAPPAPSAGRGGGGTIRSSGGGGGGVERGASPAPSGDGGGNRGGGGNPGGGGGGGGRRR